jgi:cytochrome oxidase assembly protein ShyY1
MPGAAAPREIPPALIAGAIALTLIILAGLGYWFLRPPQEQSPESLARIQAEGRAKAAGRAPGPPGRP